MSKVKDMSLAPEGVRKPTSIKAADIMAAAKNIDVSRFLPTTICVGDVNIGPADFLFAALEVLETGTETVLVEPRNQLGEISHYLPKMASANFKGTWIYTPEYKDRWTSNRLRWQFWTFRYESPYNTNRP